MSGALSGEELAKRVAQFAAASKERNPLGFKLAPGGGGGFGGGGFGVGGFGGGGLGGGGFGSGLGSPSASSPGRAPAASAEEGAIYRNTISGQVFVVLGSARNCEHCLDIEEIYL
jgi:hypothetical protein